MDESRPSVKKKYEHHVTLFHPPVSLLTMAPEETYSVGRVARLTGVSPDLLRAWERRYGAVEPVRTPGGTRRYRAEDIDRLRLLKAVVDAGSRIGDVASLSTEELERRVSPAAAVDAAPLERAIAALARLDGVEAEQLIAGQLAGLGPVRFAKEFALPLLQRIGHEWREERMCVAAEHMGSALLRSLLGSALRPTAAHRGAPVVVFATLPGERHDIGLLIAALAALGAGAQPVFLGADLPVPELVRALELTGGQAVALSAVVQPREELEAGLEELRAALPDSVEIWVGGAAADGAETPEGVRPIETLARLEQRVELLRVASGA